MVILDRIRLTGLLRKPLQMQGFLFSACITDASRESGAIRLSRPRCEDDRDTDPLD